MSQHNLYMHQETQKNYLTSFIVILTLLYWSGSEPARSQKHSCQCIHLSIEGKNNKMGIVVLAVLAYGDCFFPLIFQIFYNFCNSVSITSVKDCLSGLCFTPGYDLLTVWLPLLMFAHRTLAWGFLPSPSLISPPVNENTGLFCPLDRAVV